LQLALPVSLPINQTFESYYSPEHQDVIAHLKSLSERDARVGSALTLLCGVEGTGKSHLIYSVCNLADQLGLSCAYLNLDSLQSIDPLMLENSEHQDIICLDNVHNVAGNTAWERAIFDLINKVNERIGEGEKIHLLFSLADLPNHSDFQLPDLVSRLNWGTTFKLHEPNDEVRKQIVMLRAQLQGLSFSDAACNFLMSHTNRHLPALMTKLEEIDALSLQSKRKITVPLLKKLLD